MNRELFPVPAGVVAADFVTNYGNNTLVPLFRHLRKRWTRAFCLAALFTLIKNWYDKLQMRIEIDQSVRIDNTQKDTILAFSNRINKSVRIPVKVKRKCLKILRDRGIAPKNIYLKLFAAGLFILIRNHINQISTLVIDTEFSDRQSQQFIKMTLFKKLQSTDSRIMLDDITFRRIGKESEAHKKAYNTHKGKVIADYKVKTKELLELVQ